jgi:hypothetical protein
LQQEDIRNYIDSSLKRGHDLATFRKERVGGDSIGISYWWVDFIISCMKKFLFLFMKSHSNQVILNRYEDDEVLGHRLYRGIRRVEQIKKEPGKRSKGKGGSSAIAIVSYQWETVASNFDEFDDVAVSF